MVGLLIVQFWMLAYVRLGGIAVCVGVLGGLLGWIWLWLGVFWVWFWSLLGKLTFMVIFAVCGQ